MLGARYWRVASEREISMVCSSTFSTTKIRYTEVQRVSFVGYTGGEGGRYRLWNLQNLPAVPS